MILIWQLLEASGKILYELQHFYVKRNRIVWMRYIKYAIFQFEMLLRQLKLVCKSFKTDRVIYFILETGEL